MLKLNHLIGFGVGGSNASASYIGKASTDAMTNPYTFVNQAIGAADPTRRVFVAVHTAEAGGGTSTPTSMTIGGISASSEQSAEQSNAHVSIWSALVPTGANADIVINFDQTGNDLHIGVYRGVNLKNEGDQFVDDLGDPASLLIDVSSNGIVIAAYTNEGSAATTLGGVTEMYDDEMLDTGFRASGGFAANLGAQTNRSITADGTNGSAALVAISWS
jgi:hypothetical protein